MAMNNQHIQPDEKGLAIGWTLCQLKDCVDILDSQRVPVNSEERQQRTGNIPYYGATGQVGWIDDFLFDEKLLLIGEDGAPFFDKSKSIAYTISGKSWVNNHAHVLRSIPGLTSNYLLKHYLNQFDFRGYVNGTTRLKLTQGLMSQIPVRLPPLNEQRRIVAKLEKLLAKVDTCKERLDKIPAILKRFRQSVLSAACSGRLTADWRENNPDVESAEELLQRIQIEKEKHYKEEHEKSQLTGKRKPKQFPKNELTPLTNRAYDGLPFNWCLTRIRDVSQCLDSQRIPVSKDERAKRIGNIPYYGANGPVGWIDDYIFDADLVLIVEDETFLGRQIPFSYIIRGKSWVNNHAHVIKPLGSISVDYLNICFSFYDFVPLTSGTTGRRKLTQAALMGAEFLIAPLQEQQEIVRRVQTLFKTADRIEQRYQKARTYIDQLTQSILAKAFRGELVAQDPNDEPASVLLERIRAERENRENVAKTAKKPAANKKQRSKKAQPQLEPTPQLEPIQLELPLFD